MVFGATIGYIGSSSTKGSRFSPIKSWFELVILISLVFTVSNRRVKDVKNRTKIGTSINITILGQKCDVCLLKKFESKNIIVKQGFEPSPGTSNHTS